MYFVYENENENIEHFMLYRCSRLKTICIPLAKAVSVRSLICDHVWGFFLNFKVGCQFLKSERSFNSVFIYSLADGIVDSQLKYFSFFKSHVGNNSKGIDR